MSNAAATLLEHLLSSSGCSWTQRDIERVDDTTVAATLTLPSGDHYRIVVEWLGDREAAA